MKEYSLRLELKVQASTDEEAKKKSQLIQKELPRMDGMSFKNFSLRSEATKKIIEASTE